MFTTQHSNPDARVPAAPVRQHVENLIAAGYPASHIARLAGVETRRVTVLIGERTDHGITRLDSGPYEHRISRKIADPLLAIPIPATIFTCAVGPVRRLRALVRLGYPFDVLAAAVGYDEILLRELAIGRPEIIDTELCASIADVYERWHLAPGPSEDARRLGRRHRFASPLSWAIDDEDTALFGAGPIDDPAATPIGVPTVDRGVPPDFADIVADHRALGHFDEQIAAAMGVSTDAFAKRLNRAGIGERRLGLGAPVIGSPLYGARFTLRFPARMGVAS